MPKTMSHTKAQRKAWHDGKRRDGEGKSAWYRRVIGKRNFRGAYSHPALKSGLNYTPLPHRHIL